MPKLPTTMACAHAKYTGKLGVCVATTGPGGIHLLNGLYDAKLDGQPVLAITGLPFHDLNDTFTQQDVALDRLFMDVAAYNARVMGPSHVENVVDLACRTALAYRKVTHIAFPVDLQDMKADRKHASKRNVPGHTSDVRARSARLPDEADLRHAAEILNHGKKVAILVGQGALDATDALEQTADKLGAPIIKALLARLLFLMRVRLLPAASACWEPSHRRRRLRIATRCSWLARHFLTLSSCLSPARPSPCR